MRTTTETELITRAMSAYFKALKSTEGVQMQPSNGSGVEVVGGLSYVVLRNVGGVLAVYRVRNDGVLKRLKRWPANLDVHGTVLAT